MNRRINDLNNTLDSKSNVKEPYSKDMKPKIHFRNRKRYLKIVAKGFVALLLFMYVLTPIVIYIFPSVLSSLIFLTFIRRPWYVEYSQPQSVGLEGTRNFYVHADDGIELGTWHILPKTFVKDSVSDSWFEHSLKDGPPIIIYLHGNAGSRAAAHRVELYQILRQIDVHVIALDYRGYADSSPVTPDEFGMINDAGTVYQWVKQRAGNSPIFIWGHSLGTGVATHFVKVLNDKNEHPSGLILEAPFNNMIEEVSQHPFSALLSFAPWFLWASQSSLKARNAMFQSDKHITGIRVPILILHAEDDVIIHISLGKKLYEAAVESGKNDHVNFIQFPAKFGYNHQHICRASNLSQIIRKFTEHPKEKLA